MASPQSLIGYFDLDPNRVLDLVLEARDGSRLREMPRDRDCARCLEIARDAPRDSSRFLEIVLEALEAVPPRKSLLVKDDGINDCVRRSRRCRPARRTGRWSSSSTRRRGLIN